MTTDPYAVFEAFARVQVATEGLSSRASDISDIEAATRTAIQDMADRGVILNLSELPAGDAQ